MQTRLFHGVLSELSLQLTVFIAQGQQLELKNLDDVAIVIQGLRHCNKLYKLWVSFVKGQFCACGVLGLSMMVGLGYEPALWRSVSSEMCRYYCLKGNLPATPVSYEAASCNFPAFQSPGVRQALSFGVIDFSNNIHFPSLLGFLPDALTTASYFRSPP